MAVHAGRALFEQGIGDRRGNAQRGVLVWVYDAGTSNLSTLYTDFQGRLRWNAQRKLELERAAAGGA